MSAAFIMFIIFPPEASFYSRLANKIREMVDHGFLTRGFIFTWFYWDHSVVDRLPEAQLIWTRLGDMILIGYMEDGSFELIFTIRILTLHIRFHHASLDEFDRLKEQIARCEFQPWDMDDASEAPAMGELECGPCSYNGFAVAPNDFVLGPDSLKNFWKLMSDIYAVGGAFERDHTVTDEDGLIVHRIDDGNDYVVKWWFLDGTFYWEGDIGLI